MRSIAANTLFFLLSAILLSTVPAHAALTPSNDPCPGQGHVSTGEGGDSHIPKGLKICPDGERVIQGDCPENPTAYLLSKSKQAPSHVTGLHPDFACRLYKLLKASEQAGKNITLNSGYRSIAHQKSIYDKYVAGGMRGAPVAPPGRSKHNFGLAYDLHIDGQDPNFGLQSGNTKACFERLPSCRWLHENAGRFGLRFPMLVEPWHIEPGTPVTGGQQIPEDGWQSDEGRPYSSTPMPPTTALGNQFRQALGMQPSNIAQPAPATVSNTPAVQQSMPTPTLTQPSQSQFCVPDYKCNGNTLMYQNSFCSTQTIQVCQNGCANGACVNRPATTSPATSTTNTETREGRRASSTLEILEFLAGKESTVTEVGTSTPLQLLLSLTTDQVSTAASTTSLAPTTSVLTNMQYMSAQQTFISGDLKDSATMYPQARPQRTGALFAVLEQLKNILLRALDYIRPFSSLRYDYEHE